MLRDSPRRLSPLADQFQTTSWRSNQCSGQSEPSDAPWLESRTGSRKRRKLAKSTKSLARIVMGSMWVKPVGLSRNGSLNTSKLWDVWMTRKGLLSIQRMDHRIDWEKASIMATELFYWKRRIQEALQIQSHPTTMNLDCRLSLSHFWLLLIKPSWAILHLFIYLIFNISLHPPSLFIRSLFLTYLRVCITSISQLYHTEEDSRAEMFMVINVPMLCWTNAQSINSEHIHSNQ